MALSPTARERSGQQTAHDPEYLAPKPPDVESEYQVIMDLLRTCKHGQHQMCDPEGNLLDIPPAKI
ncbi:MAG TPA: hypothetical protein VGH22_11725 [Candidatus Binatia bacterium]